MESLGDRLRAARESKGYTQDQVSRETNIANRYIQALEEEGFEKFPGEAYLLGFLRNYGEYLGLDVQELFNSYRALKIQEQPVPVEQLLRSPPRAPKIIRNTLIILLVVALGGLLAFFFQRRSGDSSGYVAAPREPADYVMDGPFLERRFYRGDSILIGLAGNQYKIELTNLGEVLTLSAPSGPVILDLSQEVSVDLNLDSITDVLITAADFSRSDASAGALLRFDLAYTPGAANGPVPPAPSAAPGTAIPPAPVNTAATANAPVVFTSPNAYPFTLQANFQGYCMFRWEIIAERDRRERHEEYFQRGGDVSIPAQNGIRMWMSNAAAVKVQIIGGGRTVPLEIGGAGEVVVAEIRWQRAEDGRYRLVLLRLE